MNSSFEFPAIIFKKSLLFCLSLTSESRWRTEYRETAVKVAGCRTDLKEGDHGEDDAVLSLNAVSFIC